MQAQVKQTGCPVLKKLDHKTWRTFKFNKPPGKRKPAGVAGEGEDFTAGGDAFKFKMPKS